MNEYAKFTEKKTNATIKQFHVLGKKPKKKEKHFHENKSKTNKRKQNEKKTSRTGRQFDDWHVNGSFIHLFGC